MVPNEPKTGFVFRYSYLWHNQHARGFADGNKDRPCLVLAIVSIDKTGPQIVRVLPITHGPPEDINLAIEIPRLVKARLNLDDERSWIVLSESNRFVWPGPDIRPLSTATGYLGPIPPALFAKVRQGFVALARNARHRSVPRNE